MMRKFLFLILFLAIVGSVGAQRDQGIKQITGFLDSMNLEFFMPVENELLFLRPKENEFFKYDTRLKIRSNDMEVLVAFHSDTTTSPISTFFPHLEFNRLLGNIVPNEDDQEVLVIGWREQKLIKKNADWGAEAYIRPRQEITNFPFAKLISFYREDQGMVVMLYCFRKPDNVPDLIAFREEVF